MKTCILLLALLAATATARVKRYDWYQLLRLYPKDRAQADFIHSQRADGELDFWREGLDRFDVLVPPHKQESFKNLMTSNGISFLVEIENIQRNIDAEYLQMLKKGLAYDYDNFNTFQDILDEIDALAARCPTSVGVSCETFTVGTSYEGRELKALRIYAGSDRPSIWFDSLTHAREWLSVATLMKIASHLIDDFTDPNVEQLLQTYDFYILPVVNPDGYIYSRDSERLWRKSRNDNAGSSCMGTDLNRNFDQMWGNAGTSTSPCTDTYGGPSPASEPETQAVQQALSDRGSNLIVTFHFHTYGHYYLMPWGSVLSGGECNYAEDDAEMMVIANAAADATQNTYNQETWARGNSCATIYPASGLTQDYSKGVAGVKYTFTPELRGNSFIIDASQIQPSYVEMWNGILAGIRAIEQAK